MGIDMCMSVGGIFFAGFFCSVVVGEGMGICMCPMS